MANVRVGDKRKRASAASSAAAAAPVKLAPTGGTVSFSNPGGETRPWFRDLGHSLIERLGGYKVMDQPKNKERVTHLILDAEAGKNGLYSLKMLYACCKGAWVQFFFIRLINTFYFLIQDRSHSYLRNLNISPARYFTKFMYKASDSSIFHRNRCLCSNFNRS